MSQPEAKKIQTESTAESLKIHLFNSDGKPPSRGSSEAAGYDIYASEETTIPANGRALVSTALAIICPLGTYGRIAPRSGLAVKHGISTGAGVIDADYRGEVKVFLFNHNDKDFKIEKGDRIAQLILERIYTPQIQVLDDASWETAKATERGAGGFGATGTN